MLQLMPTEITLVRQLRSILGLILCGYMKPQLNHWKRKNRLRFWAFIPQNKPIAASYQKRKHEQEMAVNAAVQKI